MSGRDVSFRAEREITGVRGCGPLKGRRKMKHLGQVDLDVWTFEEELVQRPVLCFFTDMKRTDSVLCRAVYCTVVLNRL